MAWNKLLTDNMPFSDYRNILDELIAALDERHDAIVTALNMFGGYVQPSADQSEYTSRRSKIKPFLLTISNIVNMCDFGMHVFNRISGTRSSDNHTCYYYWSNSPTGVDHWVNSTSSGNYPLFGKQQVSYTMSSMDCDYYKRKIEEMIFCCNSSFYLYLNNSHASSDYAVFNLTNGTVITGSETTLLSGTIPILQYGDVTQMSQYPTLYGIE